MKKADRHIQILRDTREQTRCPFGDTYTVGKGKAAQVWTLEVETVGLPTADFSTRGHGGRDGEIRGLAIECKWGGLNECAGNFTVDRGRLEREFMRLTLFDRRAFIINDPDTDHAFMSIRSQVDREALRNSLHGWGMRYGVEVIFARNTLDMIDRLFFALRHYHEEPFKLAADRRTGKYPAATLDTRHVAEIHGAIGTLGRAVGYLMERVDGNAEDDRFDPWPADPELDAQIAIRKASTNKEFEDAPRSSPRPRSARGRRPAMPADPNPSAEELATLTAEEREWWDYHTGYEALERERGDEPLMFGAVISTMFSEMMRLRLAARPRPMEEEPPPILKAVLMFRETAEEWRGVMRITDDGYSEDGETMDDPMHSSDSYTHWLPMPPPPQEARHA